MPVTIRLTRRGAKKRPFYRVVVADSRAPRDGRVIDTLGFYDPINDREPYRIDGIKTIHWLNEGAQMTDTVKSILRKSGILAAWRAGGTGAGLGRFPGSETVETGKVDPSNGNTPEAKPVAENTDAEASESTGDEAEQVDAGQADESEKA